MATVDPLRYRTNGDDPKSAIDPNLLAQIEQVMDTLPTAQRTRIIDGEPIITPADSVYSVRETFPNMARMEIAKRTALARAHHELARHEAGLSPGEEGVVQEDLLYPGLALLTGDVRRAEDDPSVYEFIQYYSPDMRRQHMAKLTGTEGRASGGILSLLRG